MNNNKVSLAIVAAMLIASSAVGQNKEDKILKNKEEKTQEIVIRKKGNKAEKTTIVVDGDKITVDGKPVNKMENSDITVFKRDRARPVPFTRNFNDAQSLLNNATLFGNNKAVLGVLTENAENGVKVKAVNKESGAEKAGIKKDDIITKIGNTEIREPQQLAEAVGKLKTGDIAEITYKRNGKENKTAVTLGENKSHAYAYNFNNDLNFNMPQLNDFNFNFNNKPRIGLQIQDVEEGKGVKVKDVDENSPAAKAGMKESDVITQVNGKDVEGVDTLRSEIKDIKEGDSVKLNYTREGKNMAAEIKIPKRLKSADL